MFPTKKRNMEFYLDIFKKTRRMETKGAYPVETTTFVTTVQTMAKKLFQLKKIIHVDNMMKHNHVRYINSKFQTRKLSQ